MNAKILCFFLTTMYVAFYLSHRPTEAEVNLSVLVAPLLAIASFRFLHKNHFYLASFTFAVVFLLNAKNCAVFGDVYLPWACAAVGVFLLAYSIIRHIPPGHRAQLWDTSPVRELGSGFHFVFPWQDLREGGLDVEWRGPHAVRK